MNLSSQQIVRYLANIAFIARLDGRLSPREMEAISLVQSRVGAKKSDLTKAYSLAESPEFKVEVFSSFSANVQLLEDMILVALIDNDVLLEEALIGEFSDSVGLTKDQLARIIADARLNLASTTASRTCPNCNREISGQAKFCPECGVPVTEAEKAATISVEYEIPKEGIAIEFTESTASGFPEAVKITKEAPVNATCLRSKKTWYFASWPLREIGNARKLAQCLKGMRNRKVYIDGLESGWDDVFGFSWCAENRETAFKPIEYCFGLDEKRLNIWGCKQARMEWAEWASWFSYGAFKKRGLLNTQVVFEFDKSRIRHDLQTNLYRFRYCPYINLKLIDAVVDAFPSEVTPSIKGPWTYKRDYAEAPGAIKVKVREEHNGYAYTDEYYSSSVSPKSVSLGVDILKQAMKKVGHSYPRYRQFLGHWGMA